MKRRNSALGWAAIDLCTCLILVIYTLINPVVKQKIVSLPTQGAYAITQTCPRTSQNDVDLYVQDPAGNIAYFKNTTAGLMHLEQDIIPGYNNVQSGIELKIGDNERTIIRGTIPGQYVVDIHMYHHVGGSPVPETCQVDLWKIHDGLNDLASVQVTLDRQGSVGTAFEFHVNADGAVNGITHFKRDIVYTVG